jgi:dolichol-phosphate mannosyltransferase
MDKYRVASGLAFYQSKNLDPREYSKKARILAETTGSHLFGRNSLMYRYWTDPATYRDRTLLVLSSDADDLDKKRLVQYASSIGEIHQLYYDKFGRRIGPIYYRLLAGYKPFANEVAER